MNRIAIKTNDKIEAVFAARHPHLRNVWRVENVPFLSSTIHFMDWVMCEPATIDSLPLVTGVYERSGYRTLSIEWIVMDSASWATHPIHDAVAALKWPAEGCLSGIVAAVPADVPMSDILDMQRRFSDLFFRLDGVRVAPVETELDLDDVDLAADQFPARALPPTSLQEAMFDLCRACAQDYLSLPQRVLEAYQDRDHSKFDPQLWQAYLDRLTDAVRTSRKVPARVRAAYHKVAQIAQDQAVRA